MAKVRNLDEAIDENTQDFKKRIIKAAQSATEKMANAIQTNALSCLQDYYDEYDPTSYDRTNNLMHSILKTSSVKDHGDHIVCTAGIEFNDLLLEAYVASTNPHAYDASKKYGQVDGSWVITNFLMGIHPRTNGSSIPEEVEYIPITFSPSPDEKMKKHLDDKEKDFDSMLYKYFMMHK